MGKSRPTRAKRPRVRTKNTPSRNGATQAAPGEADVQRVKLSEIQTLGVQLMQAREIIKGKNTLLAKIQLSNSQRAQADAQRIKGLEAENGDLINQLMGAWNRAEESENEVLARKLGLPTGTISYKLGEDGAYYYEVEKPGAPSKRPAAPVELEDEDEDEDEELAEGLLPNAAAPQEPATA